MCNLLNTSVCTTIEKETSKRTSRARVVSFRTVFAVLTKVINTRAEAECKESGGRHIGIHYLVRGQEGQNLLALMGNLCPVRSPKVAPLL